MVPEDAAVPPDNRTPAQLAESITKGRELFYGSKANCVKCHGPTALGDGQQDDYDDWSKATNDFIKATDVLARANQKRQEGIGKCQGR